MYSNQIKKGDDYKKAKRIVLVAIIDFEIEVMKELNKMESNFVFLAFFSETIEKSAKKR